MSTATLTSVRLAAASRPAPSAARPAGRASGRPTARLSTGTADLGADRGGDHAADHGADHGAPRGHRGAPVRRSAGEPHGLVLTARGRRVVRALVLSAVTGLLAVLLVLAWVSVAASVAPGASAGDGRPGVASGAGATEARPTVAVVVAPGDTLWQLARTHSPDRDPRSVVADIVELNDLGSTGVQAGTEVLVPLG